MNAADWTNRLAVCSWSLRPADPESLVRDLERIGVRRVQLALDPLRASPQTWGDIASLFREKDLEIVSGMFVTVGEDYSSLESIRRTGGVVPDGTWDENWRNIEAEASIAEMLGVKLVTFHAGFLPHDTASAEFHKLHDRLALIADLFGARGISLGLETGQETAETLRVFLEKLNRPNVGVNFDPANMIIYNMGDPIESLRALGPWLRQAHLKDASRTQVRDKWGREVVLGTGDVDWRGFFRALDELKFSGNLAIEREAGEQRVEDIRAARQFVESLKTD